MCWKCSEPLDTSVEIYRTSVCPACGTDLHSCRNCRFYDPGAHYDCHETVDELVTDKERANFCDFFSPALGISSGKGTAPSNGEARAAFDSLFSL